MDFDFDQFDESEGYNQNQFAAPDSDEEPHKTKPIQGGGGPGN